MIEKNDCVCEQCQLPSYVRYPQFEGRHLCRYCYSKAKYPRWLRGKFNGMRIVGIRFKVVFSVNDWRWKPMLGHSCGAFHWLFWKSWTEAEFEY